MANPTAPIYVSRETLPDGSIRWHAGPESSDKARYNRARSEEGTAFILGEQVHSLEPEKMDQVIDVLWCYAGQPLGSKKVAFASVDADFYPLALRTMLSTMAISSPTVRAPLEQVCNSCTANTLCNDLKNQPRDQSSDDEARGYPRQKSPRRRACPSDPR